MFFASDNAGPVAPEVMAALADANRGNAAPYGDDPLTAEVRARIRDLFEAPEAAVHLVATGTAANALSLALLARPWDGVFCHREAHVEEDECGAPEFFTGGAKLVLVAGDDARMDPADLDRRIAATAQKGVHGVQRGPVSLTQITELGAAYTLDHIRDIAAIARRYGLALHMDGARFANALVTLGCTPAEMTWQAGIDILSFGGTKNGLMGVEAVVIFDPDRAWEFELRRKRAGHLFSKHRYLAAQMLAYLTGDLWLNLAKTANAKAARLAQGLLQVPGARLLHPRDGNMLFVGLPRAVHRRLRAAGAEYYLWPFEQSLDGPDDTILTARLVCHWATSDDEIARFLEIARAP